VFGPRERACSRVAPERAQACVPFSALTGAIEGRARRVRRMAAETGPECSYHADAQLLGSAGRSAAFVRSRCLEHDCADARKSSGLVALRTVALTLAIAHCESYLSPPAFTKRARSAALDDVGFDTSTGRRLATRAHPDPYKTCEVDEGRRC